MIATTSLTERRKADRAKMASELVALAENHGATVQVARGQTVNMFTVSIATPRGLQVQVELDGKSIQPDVHVLPWHIAHDADERLNPAFGEVNPHHHRKATHVAYGFDALFANVKRGLQMAADGSAYQVPLPAQPRY